MKLKTHCKDDGETLEEREFLLRKAVGERPSDSRVILELLTAEGAKSAQLLRRPNNKGNSHSSLQIKSKLHLLVLRAPASLDLAREVVRRRGVDVLAVLAEDGFGVRGVGELDGEELKLLESEPRQGEVSGVLERGCGRKSHLAQRTLTAVGVKGVGCRLSAERVSLCFLVVGVLVGLASSGVLLLEFAELLFEVGLVESR